MQWELERYKRQLGLVHQRRVMDLRVVLVGEGPALPYAATNLALLGVGAGKGGIFLPARHASSPQVTAQHLPGQFLFRPEDVGTCVSDALARRIAQMNAAVNTPRVQALDETAYDVILAVGDSQLPASLSNAPVVWAGVTNFGVYVGAQKPQVGTFTANLLTPALASLCGALAAQEVLRMTHCLRGSEIERFWVTLNYVFRGSAALPDSDGRQSFSVGGEPASTFRDDADKQNPVYRVPVNLGNAVARHLFEHTTIDETLPPLYTNPVSCLYYSPFVNNHLDDGVIIEEPVALPELAARHIVLGGIGGLGTWVAALLAVSGFSGELTVFDSDTQIEQHNLNRQVLYDDAMIGLPKVQAAVRALHGLNPSLTVSDLLEEIQPTTAVTRAELMAHADLAISTFDNFRARYVFAEWAALHKVALVNGGSEGFAGDVEVIVPEKNGCLLCFWQQEKGKPVAEAMSLDEAHLSCTREAANGNAPEVGTAIVTTTAAIASLQSLFALLTLSQPDARRDHHLGYFGKENALEKCRLHQRNANGQCPIHDQGPCQHPQQFWHNIEETILGGIQWD